jgi:UDP-2-acetamido-3-amino-2,3-dideoxy-glucuronate N-acetyltransferase
LAPALESGTIATLCLVVKSGKTAESDKMWSFTRRLFYSGVICEDDVFLGPSMVFTNVLYPRSFIDRKTEFCTTRIGQGASIGANATILCGLTVGRYALIGAGAVVTKDVPDFALVYGNPARQQGWVCKCGLTLDFKGEEAVCRDCQAGYQKVNSAKIAEIG